MSNSSDLRYELKAPLWSTAQVDAARQWIRLSMAGIRPDFPTRMVNSIYFDTPEYSDLNANLAGVGERHKLRLRWYGPLLTHIVNPILELKFRSGGTGDKKRVALAGTYDLSQSWHTVQRQLLHDIPIEWWARLSNRTQPTLLVRYKRDYFATADRDVRITLDYAMDVYPQRMAGRPNLRRVSKLPAAGVLEIKSDPRHADRLQGIITALPVARQRHSKYVSGIMATW